MSIAALRQVLGKPFQAPKIIYKSPKWTGHIFDRAIFSGFTMRFFRTKGDFKTQNQVIFLDLRFRLA